MAKTKSLVGQKIGRLTVIERVDKDKHGNIRYLCHCECGNTNYIVTGSHLRSSRIIKSCGCYRKEKKGPKIDLTGSRFGRLIAIRNEGLAWLCRCDCGNEKWVSGAYLRSGMTKSCGCLRCDRTKSTAIDLTGKQFGKLTVIKRAENPNDRNAKWLCKCDCGGEIVVYGQSLRTGDTRSCGCLERGRPKKYGIG